MDFLVRKDDLHECRFADGAAPEPTEGEGLLRVTSFGLTTNNITYAVFGDAMNYWDFFPAADGWGKLPVWGFGEVAAFPGDEIAQGTRLYGYYPLASHLLVRPGRVDERGFYDAAPHREPLPSAYHAYRRTDADPVYDPEREDEQILFWPLFYTSFLVDDQLDDEGFFGAESIVISSASSKTAVIAAYLLAQRDGPDLIGLTSPGNREFVEGLGIYDTVVTYDDVASLGGERVVYADFAGNAETRGAVHTHLGNRLAHSMMIGMTHWTEMAVPEGAGTLPGPKPSFFFAPDRVRKRGKDWGTAKLEERVAEAWRPFAEWAGGWLEVKRISEPDEIKRVYLELVEGEVDPRAGHVVELAG
jgi:hypothetical protein